MYKIHSTYAWWLFTLAAATLCDSRWMWWSGMRTSRPGAGCVQARGWLCPGVGLTVSRPGAGCPGPGQAVSRCGTDMLAPALSLN